jgi:hypothetical protein
MPLRPNAIQFSPLSHLTRGSGQLKSPKCPGLPPLLCYKPSSEVAGHAGRERGPCPCVASPLRACARQLPSPSCLSAMGTRPGRRPRGAALPPPPTGSRRPVQRGWPADRPADCRPPGTTSLRSWSAASPSTSCPRRQPALLRRGAPPLDLQPAPRLLPSLVMIQSSATLTSST